MNIISRTESDTTALGITLAKIIKSHTNLQPVVITLSGDLGMGKSVFARAFIRTLCDQPGMDVPSPTFTLVQQYESTNHVIRHFDLYRLEDPEEIYEIGWEDAVTEGISLIEWPERLDYLKAPKNTININISQNDEESRLIHITAGSENTAHILQAMEENKI